MSSQPETNIFLHPSRERCPGLVHLTQGAFEETSGIVHRLARAQWALGPRVQVWNIAASGDAIPPPGPYATRRFRVRRRWRRMDRALVQAIEAAPRPTLFHLHGGGGHGWGGHAMARAARAIRRAGHAYVYTPRGSCGRGLSRRERALLVAAQRVQAGSEREAAHIARSVPRDRIVLVADGQDLIERTGSPSAIPARPLFGCAGRLDAGPSGLDVLIDAFASYAGRHPGSLRLVGPGPDRSKLEQRAARAGVADRVEFTGTLDERQRLAALSDCDVFVQPSRDGLAPRALLEAAALGLPLVVTAGTGLAHRVLHHRAGLALGETAIEPLVDALTVMGCSPDRVLRGWSLGARELVRAGFSWEGVAAELERDLYRSMRGRSVGRSSALQPAG